MTPDESIFPTPPPVRSRDLPARKTLIRLFSWRMPLYVYICERSHAFEFRSVRRQILKTHPGRVENSPDNQKRMFGSGSDCRFCAIFRMSHARRFVSCAPFIGHIPGLGSRLPDRFFRHRSRYRPISVFHCSEDELRLSGYDAHWLA